MDSLRAPAASEEFRPARWLPNAHWQTIYAATLAPCPGSALHRTRWDTPDGDFIDGGFGSVLPGRPIGRFPEPARNDDPPNAFAFAAAVLEVLFEYAADRNAPVERSDPTTNQGILFTFVGQPAFVI